MTDVSGEFDPGLRRAVSKGKGVAVIPVGSLEQHGPHLPVSTDSEIVTEVARRVSERMGFLLLPTIRYGVSFEHAPLFQLSVRAPTLRAVLADLCVSLRANNVRTAFVINGHHGNLRPLRGLDNKVASMGCDMGVFILPYWRFMAREFDHAGFAETSLMLAVSKNVRMKHARKGLVTDGMDARQKARLARLADRSFPEATGNGIWGDPRGATRAAGRALLAEITENLGKECQACLAGRGP